jgi:hypothetical protein
VTSLKVGRLSVSGKKRVYERSQLSILRLLNEDSLTTDIIIIILTANGFLLGGSGTTRHNTQLTHLTQNDTTIK